MTASVLLGFLGGLGGGEILLIALVLLLMFGGKKIPELMRGLGKGIKEFKDASNGKEERLPPIQKNKPLPGSNPVFRSLPALITFPSFSVSLNSTGGSFSFSLNRP